MKTHEMLVIGGGASGMIAAIIANEYGNDVAVLEGQNRIGKKVLTTGNGRCNIANSNIVPPYSNYHSFNPKFYTNVLDQLTVNDTLDLFYRLGIPIIELKKGKLYPKSLQAASVVDLLRMNIDEKNIPIYIESLVTSIKRENGSFVIGVNHPDYKQFKCKKLIIATGGISAPFTGSDGSMFKMLEKLGHTITHLLPSIVQLKLNYNKLKSISGVRFDALVHVKVNGDLIRTDFDEVLFTDYGISGPAILQVSRNASIALAKKQKVDIVIDIFHDYTKQEVIDFFDNHFGLFSHRTVSDSLNGILNKKLIPILLRDAGIEIHKTCDTLTYLEKKNLYHLFKEWTFECTDTNGFKNAQATIGGVDTREVDDKTLESKVVENLYFCGEVLDVDGDCGGFNLQWAWSSGFVCGKSQ